MPIQTLIGVLVRVLILFASFCCVFFQPRGVCLFAAQTKIKKFQQLTDRFRGGLIKAPAYYGGVEELFGEENVTVRGGHKNASVGVLLRWHTVTRGKSRDHHCPRTPISINMPYNIVYY